MLLESLNGFKFIFVFLNLIILYIVLRKLLFKPITEFMDNRTKTISDALENADKSKAESLALKQKYQDQLKGAKEEADKILEAAHSRGTKEYDEMVASAKKDANAIMEKAKEEIEREKVQMIKEVRGQIAGLALMAASKVIEANMDTETNRVLVDKFIDEAGAA
jgi:F-type H+-transporting ATPase subunit b